MAEKSSWVPTRQLANNELHIDDLEISFQRTLRVPDNHESSHLPPSFGKFPVYEVKDYKHKLPRKIAAKGGLFLPMYRKLSSRHAK
jgi:hypothetical protein